MYFRGTQLQLQMEGDLSDDSFGYVGWNTAMQRNICDSFPKTWTLQTAYTGHAE